MGVDPHADEQQQECCSSLRKWSGVILYRLKVVITGFMMKILVVKQYFSPQTGLWLRPVRPKTRLTCTRSSQLGCWAQWLGPVLMTILWDSIVAHAIIRQAQIRGIGVFISGEVFNEGTCTNADSLARSNADTAHCSGEQALQVGRGDQRPGQGPNCARVRRGNRDEWQHVPDDGAAAPPRHPVRIHALNRPSLHIICTSTGLWADGVAGSGTSESLERSW